MEKNLQYWWEKSGEYGLALDLSKDIISVGNSCNSNIDDFEEITDWRKMMEKCVECMTLYNSRKL
jgi:hypothetical protein